MSKTLSEHFKPLNDNKSHNTSWKSEKENEITNKKTFSNFKENDDSSSKFKKRKSISSVTHIGGSPLVPTISSSADIVEEKVDDVDIELSSSQKHVLDLIMSRKSVFFSGVAITINRQMLQLTITLGLFIMTI